MSPRDWMPREHALWSWVLVPCVASALIAPTPAVLLAISALVAAFLTWNAAMRALRGSPRAARAAGVSAIAAGLAVIARLASAPSGAVVAAFALPSAIAAVVAWRRRGQLTPNQPQEAALIVAFAAWHTGLLALAGVDVAFAASAHAAVAAWHIVGLWWIQRALAGLLPGRVPWEAGPAWVAAASLVAAVVHFGADRVWWGALPLVYPARVALHAAPTSARDARRVGLTELVWALGVAGAATLGP